MKKTIKVSQEIIDKANQLAKANSQISLIKRCPIALAAQAAGMPKACYTGFSLNPNGYNDNDRCLPPLLQVPQKAKRLAEDWDRCLKIEPMEFEIEYTE